MNQWECGKMKRIKTAKQFEQESIDAAKALPLEVKKKFWSAMTEDKKNLGEARKIAGIDDVMVAAQLVILCHGIYKSCV